MASDVAGIETRLRLRERYARIAATRAYELTVRWTVRVLMFAALFGVWELAVELGWVREIIVPRPSSVVGAIDDILGADTFPTNLWTTMKETFAGFGIGVAAALVMAVLLTLYPLLRLVLTDYLLALQAIPKVTLIPILITWFGFGVQSKIILAALITFFPVYINAMVGLNNIGAPEIKLMRSWRASRYQRMYMLQFPHGLPTMFAGFKNGITNSLIGATIAEFLGASAGLGQLIVLLQHRLQIAEIFVIILVLSVITLILYYSVDRLEKWICFWIPVALAARPRDRR